MPANRTAAAVLPAIAVLASAGAGCTSHGPVIEPQLEAGQGLRVELEGTPFFPQRGDQCGPAALATVLAAAGAEVSPELLAAEVYLPGRHGSLQPELLAATRRHGRVPYLLPPAADALFATVAGGRPVLLLQKLGAGPWPGWHYAVLVGYDAARDRVVLRSGTERRKQMSARGLLASWERAGRWAMAALAPGELPPAADFTRYLQAVAGLEAVGRPDLALPGYQAAARAWPDQSLPRLAVANVAYARGDLAGAELGLREALRLDPGNVAARNNRAEVLRQLGCGAAARRDIAVARAVVADGPLAADVEATARDIAASAPEDAAGCPGD